LHPGGRLKHSGDHFVGQIAAEGLSDESIAQFHLVGEALQLGLDPLAVGDVRPGTDTLRRRAVLIVPDRKGILDPDVVPPLMPEAVLDGSSPGGDQLIEFGKRSLISSGWRCLVQNAVSSRISQGAYPITDFKLSLTNVQARLPNS
jgi:hypothetical protein